MAAARSVLATLIALAISTGAHAAPAPPDTVHADSTRADTTRAARRTVRTFPPIEVWATLHDPGSSETVHIITPTALHAFPVDNFADAVAIQAGVVAQGEELHVRGGRNGETAMFLDGIRLDEPLRGTPMELPLLGLRGADLVSGSPEAQYGSGLAGALEVHTVDPSRKPSLAWRWQSALDDRWFDRWAVGGSAPLPMLGLGVAAAADATLDDSWLPDLRSDRKQKVAGVTFDWRADNHVLGWAKIAPIDRPQRFSAQVLVTRRLERPYDRAWTTVITDPYSGAVVYRAADHLATTDERRTATLLTLSNSDPARRATLSLGWVRTRAVTSLTGARGRQDLGYGPIYSPDGFDVIGGDYPLYRESGSDALTLRGDAEMRKPSGFLRAGAGATYEDVTLYELDNSLPELPVDHLREYHAFAPGGFGYVQGRWEAGGLLLNTGLRAEYFTPGPEGRHQTLPWDGHGVWTWSPRLGFAYPVSVRDAFSLSYSRIYQAPGRDYLYDHRRAITDRQPLGNPALQPATVISYEAAVKHTYSPRWAMQTSVFYRDIAGQVGVRFFSHAGLPNEWRYESEDDGHAGGIEWSLVHVNGERRRLEVHYTLMEAWGLESRPEGDPYGPLLGARIMPTNASPLSWDRRHSILLAWTWPWKDDWSFSWSTAVGSPLPWTPKPLRAPLTDLGLIDSGRLDWSENTNLNVEWTPSFAHGLTVGFEARNLFDNRGATVATVDGYPNPIVNTYYDDYGAYRTETGRGGGAYWRATSDSTGYWVPVHDPRLQNPPRTVRVSVGANW